MATPIPNIYTFGQVQLDTQPLAQLQGRLIAKKQAEEEALNKYFTDASGKLTPTGMRQQDVAEFLKKKDELMREGIAKKAEISRGGLAKQEFNSKLSQLFADIDKSKQVGKLEYDLFKAKQEGKLNKKDYPKLDAIKYSIYNPSHYKDFNTKTSYSFDDFSPAIKLPDAAKQASFYNAVSQDLKPKEKEYEKDDKGKIIYTPGMPGSFKKIAKFTERYSDDQIKGMADKASQFTKFDDGFYKLFQSYLDDAADATKNKMPISPEFKELNDLYTKFYPGDIMDEPEEVAKAVTIRNFKNVVNTGTDEEEDKEAAARFQSQQILSRQKSGGGEIDLSQYDVLGPYTKAKGVKTKGFLGIGGGKTLIYKKDIDPKDYELIADKDVMPFVDAKGDEYFEVDTNTGDWKAENATINASSVARRNLDRTTLAEEKRGALRIKPGSPIPGKSVPSGKTYKVDGKTFTLDQMKKGASKAKMSLDEYLKSINAQ